MPIKYVTRDLLESDCNILAHGVNCKNGFGSGIAGQIAKKYPKAKEDYHNAYNDLGIELGWVYYSNIRPGLVIAHCATQNEYLPRGVCHADYEAIESCMDTLKTDTPLDYKIGMPKIGCGLAGGDWEIVEKILNKVFTDRDVWVYSL